MDQFQRIALILVSEIAYEVFEISISYEVFETVGKFLFYYMYYKMFSTG